MSNGSWLPASKTMLSSKHRFDYLQLATNPLGLFTLELSLPSCSFRDGTLSHIKNTAQETS
eukprot:973797-Amphidinium_carterae.1